ncbi:MAG: hypothetical protein LBP86_05780 [Azoarcus sp.]|jgi:hypothetical protein|nr:hypothetical protein [Azoarcus sp.]
MHPDLVGRQGTVLVRDDDSAQDALDQRFLEGQRGGIDRLACHRATDE